LIHIYKFMQLKHKLMPIFAQESYFLVYIALISVLIIDNQMWSQINSLLRELSFPNFDFRAVISIIINLFFFLSLVTLLALTIMRRMPDGYRNIKIAYLIIFGILIYIAIGVLAGFNGIAVNAKDIFNINYDDPFFQTLLSNVSSIKGISAVAGVVLSFSLALQSVLTLRGLFSYENYEKENDFFEISRKTDKKILIITSTVLVFVILLGRFIFDYYWLINLSVALGISNIIAGIMAQQQRQCLQIEKHNQIILK